MQMTIRILVCSWAKQIPGFTELPLCDQMKMLQVNWAEVLTLQVAHRSLPFTGKIYFATDFWLEERSAKECGAVELYNHVSAVLCLLSFKELLSSTIIVLAVRSIGAADGETVHSKGGVLPTKGIDFVQL